MGPTKRELEFLKLYRRHLPKCKDGRKDAERSKCQCPIWCDGHIGGERVRKSLKTRDWQRAIRLADRIERPNSERSDLTPCAQPGCDQRVARGRCERHQRTVPDAIQAFHDAHPDLEHATKLKYQRTLKLFHKFAAGAGLATVDQIDPDAIDKFRAARKIEKKGRPVTAISALTWMKELQILRGFFRFCIARDWTMRNPAALVAIPKNIKPTDKEPYSRNEVTKILAACENFGLHPYERLRARAMVLLLRYTALRVSDVALLARDRVRDGEIYLRTLKSGKIVRLPAHPELKRALDMVPVPRGVQGEARFYFWSGNGTARAAVRDTTRTLTAVFRESEVPGAHAHRFRHTMATELLEAGGTLEDVAEILGNSPNIVRKHYAKWTRARQERISTLMRSVFGTKLVHEKSASASN